MGKVIFKEIFIYLYIMVKKKQNFMVDTQRKE